MKLRDGFATSPAEAQQKLASYRVNVVYGLGAEGTIAVYWGGSSLNLSRIPGIKSVSRNSTGQSASEENAAVQSTAGSDPMTAELWGHQKINVEAAWAKVNGAAGAVVAVLDTGIDMNHPDLAAAVFHNPSEIAGNRIDDDGNGFKDDVNGYNFVNNNNNPSDDHYHGTHVSGTIGAVANGTRMQGVAYGVSILPLKVMNSNSKGTAAVLIRALNYVTLLKKNGANIIAINASVGGFDYSSVLYEAIDAAGRRGIAFVASAGNKSVNVDNSPSYPASFDFPNVVSVAATEMHDELWQYSNYETRSILLHRAISSSQPSLAISTLNFTVTLAVPPWPHPMSRLRSH